MPGPCHEDRNLFVLSGRSTRTWSPTSKDLFRDRTLYCSVYVRCALATLVAATSLYVLRSSLSCSKYSRDVLPRPFSSDSPPPQVSLSISRGPLLGLPYTSSYGEKPVLSFSIVRSAHIKYGILRSHSRGLLEMMIWWSIFLTF